MLFRLSDVYKSYGVQDVLRGASLQVNAGEHVGLVGRNGAGKSTIFRLVRGEETADRGDVIRARGVKLGLLDQHVHFKPGSTVHESALAAFGRLQQIEHEMHELEHRMADAGDDLEKVLERYSDLQQEFEHEGGFEYAAKAESILQGLGFDRDTWSLETDKLSGGQQNRLGLACLLLASPDVLLLDEPTNHLDFEMRHSLITALQGFAGAVIVVSHDRGLLRSVCDQFWLVADGAVTDFEGDLEDYSNWLEKRGSTASTPSVPKPRGEEKGRGQKRKDTDGRKEREPKRQEIKSVESSLEKLGQERARLEKELAGLDYNRDPAHARKVTERHAALIREVELLETRWLELSERLESLNG